MSSPPASPTVAAIGPDMPATQRQLRYLQAVARESGYSPETLDNRAQQEFKKQALQLSRREASQLIDLIQAEDAKWKSVW